MAENSQVGVQTHLNGPGVRAVGWMAALSSQAAHCIAAAPGIWDLWSQWYGFRHRVAACRGVYTSARAAAKAAPRGGMVGYDNQAIAGMRNVSVGTARRQHNEFDPRDYPVLLHLERSLRKDGRLFNLGGNVGTEFYAYEARIAFPNGLLWRVCEVPEICKAGRQLAAEKGETRLEFTTAFSAADGFDILLTCGTLQYIEQELGMMLESLNRKPSLVIVNRVAIYDGPGYITLQNLGYSYTPYFVRNRTMFIDRMSKAGFVLVDCWKDNRRTRIPMHFNRTVDGYWGFVFRRN